MIRTTGLRLAALTLTLFACALTSSAPAALAAFTAQDADVNQDNYVNVLDLVAVSRRDTPRADVNHDGVVNSLDFQAVAQFFGTSLLRDKFKQPFSSDSIWNMPIGSGAEVRIRELRPLDELRHHRRGHMGDDNASDPVKEITDDRAFWDGPRCSSTRSSGVFTSVPDSLVVPDVTPNYRPNRAAAILQPDGRTIIQVNALARCVAGGPIFGIYHYTTDIYGQGIKGGAGGSGLSSIGGTIRKGELLPGGAIKHALKINVTCAVTARRPSVQAVGRDGGGR